MIDRPITLTELQLREMITETVAATLLSVGIEVTDVREVQADMAYLREWRRSMTEVKTKGLMALVTIAVTGVAGAVWLAVKGRG